MARQARLFIPQCPLLLELKSLGGAEVFRTREAFLGFQQRIPKSAQEEHVDVHAYCLVPTGALFMVSSEQPQAIGRFVQNLNRHVSALLRRQALGGLPVVWAPRFKSAVIQPGERSLQALWYVDSWAARLGQAFDLEAYVWGSYAAHVGHAAEPWLSDLPSYWQLGNTPFERQHRYKQFGEQGLAVRHVEEIDQCVRGGWLWSDDAFFLQVQHTANRPPRPRPRGRIARAEGCPVNGA